MIYTSCVLYVIFTLTSELDLAVDNNIFYVDPKIIIDLVSNWFHLNLSPSNIKQTYL